MAKAGGTTEANVNVQVLGADATRQSISVHNLEHNNHIIFLEFDAPASTVLTDGSFAIAGPELILHVEDWPEIRGTVNLKATSTVDYIVRTEESPEGAPVPPYVPPTPVTFEVYGVNLAADSITVLANDNVPTVGTRFKVTTPGTLGLDGNPALSSVFYYVISVDTVVGEEEEDTFSTIKISSREDRSRVVDVSAGPENDPLASTGIILTVV